MTPQAYFGEVIRRSWRAGKKAVHELHFWLLIAAGIALIWLGLHLEELALAILLPLGLFIAVFTVSLFWQGYVIYREEFVKRTALESRPDDHSQMYANWREEDIREQLTRLNFDEKYAMNELVKARRLTQEQVSERLKNVNSNLRPVTLEVLATKAHFVTRDFVGTWFIIREALPIVERILPTL